MASKPHSEPVVGTPEPDYSGFGTRQQMREEIIRLQEQLKAAERAILTHAEDSRLLEQYESREAIIQQKANEVLEQAFQIAELKEQLEAAHRNMDRYGMALAEILERPHGELDEHEMRSLAHAALNPAKKPKEV
jgi:hypothetical protein